MPIYEYECDTCHHHFEILQKVSEEPLTYCPECGEHTLRKLISAAAFRLKGGGWYETDFKTGGQRNVIKPDEKSGGEARKTADKPAEGSGGTEKKKAKTSGDD
jgi:putative FmdB family regulatory protein